MDVNWIHSFFAKYSVVNKDVYDVCIPIWDVSHQNMSFWYKWRNPCSITEFKFQAESFLLCIISFIHLIYSGTQFLLGTTTNPLYETHYSTLVWILIWGTRKKHINSNVTACKSSREHYGVNSYIICFLQFSKWLQTNAFKCLVVKDTKSVSLSLMD